MYETVVRPLLFRLDAERAHDLAMRASELGGRSGLTRRIAHRDVRGARPAAADDASPASRFANPLGLAAGFDKNGRAAPMLGALGFGHVEIGSVSAHPSDGNPRPRLFRIPEDRGIVVAYGVPNEGADAVAARLAGSRVRARVGVNLVKTNDPARPAVEPDVYEDYAASLARLQDRADYVALNLSCPNSAADRDFFDDLPRIDGCSPRSARSASAGRCSSSSSRRRTPACCARSSPSPTAIRSSPASRINLPAGKPDDAGDPRDAARAAGGDAGRGRRPAGRGARQRRSSRRCTGSPATATR